VDASDLAAKLAEMVDQADVTVEVPAVSLLGNGWAVCLPGRHPWKPVASWMWAALGCCLGAKP
jgi:hypothetical protein